MKYWLREIELTVGDRKWFKDHKGGLEIKFNVKNSTNEDKENPTLDLSTIEIYNLNQDSRNSIKKGNIVILNVGYDGDRGNILSGVVETVSTRKEGLTRITEIICTAGGKGWRESKMSKTYANGTKASYIMRDLVNSMGYQATVIEPNKDIEFELGYSVYGPCKNSLNRLVKDTNSKMYIKDNKVTISSRNSGIENGFHISSKTGLLTTPELQDNKTTEEDEQNKDTRIFYTLSCKFNYELTIDSFITIESESANGKYRILDVEHSDDFTTNLKVVEVY